jgi:large subunit ribosomal protein L2
MIKFLILKIKKYFINNMLLYKNYIINYINKKIKIGLNSKSGRNFMGRICVHHKISTKCRYIKIDFYRRINCFGYIYRILKNTNRSAYIAGIIYENGLYANILLTEKVKIGSKIYSGILYNKEKKNFGYTYLIKNINLFTIISNIELNPYNGISLVRSAGTKSILTKIDKNKISLKLKSG